MMLVAGAMCLGLTPMTLAQNAPPAPPLTPPSTPPTTPPAQSAADDVWRGLVMRSGMEPPVGRPIALGIEGLTVEAGEGVTARRFQVGLDRIAEPPTALASSFDRVRSVAQRAWRARIRLERGDLVAAEPLLDDLAKELGTATGATPELVYRGLLACRLARGVHTGALESYIRWRLAAEGLGEESTSGAGLDAAIDRATRLAPQLPPMWVEGPATQAFARSTSPVGAGATGASAALARLYVAAAKAASHEPTTEPWDPLAPGVAVGSAAVGDEGVGLVRDIVAARLGDDSTRNKARNDLIRRRSASIPAWQHAWILTGVGQSLVRETDRELRLRGVATLLEVSARYDDACPYLTGLAMADAAMTLADLGDVPAALRLRSDLAARWPGHAAMDVPGLRGLTDRGPTTAPPPTLPEPPPAPPEPAANTGGNETTVGTPDVDTPDEDPK